MTSGEHGTHDPIPDADPSATPHAGATPATEIIPPLDRRSLFGWTHLHRSRRQPEAFREYHKIGSVMMAFLASAAASAISAANNWQSFEGLNVSHDQEITSVDYASTQK